MPRIAEGHPGQRRHHAKLRNDDPASPSPQEAAEDGRIVAVEKGRPQEFELVGEGELAHQADRGDRHLRLIEPGRLGDVDELKGDARRETEHQHRRNSPVGEKMTQEGRRFGALCARILHVDPRPEGSLTELRAVADRSWRRVCARAALVTSPAQHRLYRIVAPSGMDRVERTHHLARPIFAPKGD